MFTLRSVEVISPVGGDSIVLERMSGSEALGRLFEYSVDLLSMQGDLDISSAVGKGMTVAMTMGDRPPRFFHGLVTRFAQVAWTGDRFRYRAELRPWLWLLSRSSDSRIFQKKTVPEVLSEVFEQHGLSGVVDDKHLDGGHYQPHEYLVQYNETDFNFVSRLMEQAGISYYFTHAEDNHKMVLFDGPITEGDAESIPFFPGDGGGADAQSHEHVEAWSVGVQIEPGAFAAKEFDFTKPRAPLLSARQHPGPGATSAMEMFEYPGLYIDTGARELYVTRKLEEEQLDFEQAHGAGNARGLRAGGRFELTGYPWAAQNKEYLVIAATHELVATNYSSGGDAAQPDYTVSFFAIDSQRTYRTPVTTPRPHVAGPQTAIVCGPDGQEIFTDPDGYGRVKVQFHWDRTDKKGEDRSCWVRVSQAWAGAQWGAMHIPRIGQEVIVDFLEGDPDRPLITGRVYNASQPVPYALPANKTQSGIKSRSTPGGGPSNFNEIRFEDKKGSEELFVQAEKDHTTNVKNNQATTVGADRTLGVGGNDSTTVGGDRSRKVTGNDSTTIGQNQTLSVTGNRTKTVTANESVTIGASSTETVAIVRAVTIGAAYQITVGGAMNETVGAAKVEEVGAAKSVAVAGVSSETVGGSKSIKAGSNVNLTSGKVTAISAGTDLAAQASKNLTVEAGDQLTIKCGSATIVLKKSGDITINGKKVDVSASGDLVMKGSKISGN